MLGGVVVLLALFMWQNLQITGGELGVPLDDAWIHYQFARNISQGNGFSYNPGQPTPGSTSPLWTILLAGVGLFTESFIVPSILLSSLFLLLTVWMVYRLMLLLEFPSGVALLAAFGTGLAGRLLWAGLSGMEVTLFAFLSLTAVYFYQQSAFSWKTAVLLGLASQVRPEAHLLFLFIAGDSFVTQYRVEKVPLKAIIVSFIVPSLIYALINVPYSAFSLSVTGRPLPNTFYAKSDSTQLFSLRTLRELGRTHFQDNRLLFLLIPLGIRPLWQRSRVTVLWLLGLFFVTPMVVPFLWHHGRYTMPLIPFMMIAGAGGAWSLWQYLWITNTRLLLSAFALIVFTVGAVRLPFWATMLGNNSQEILQIDVALGHWLAQNTPETAVIAVDDIGAIGFLSGREIFDLNGLISPEVWPVMNDTEPGIPRDAAMTRLLSAVRPDYLAIFPEWHWNIAINPQIVREVAQFTTETQTIIGGKRAFVYESTRWPFGETAVTATATTFNFGDGIQLNAYEMTQTDNQLHIAFYWHCVAPITQSYDVFVHVYDSSGNLVAQSDSVPVATLLPTDLWQVDDHIQDAHQLILPADLPAGAYQIAVGFFHRPTGDRLPVGDDGVILGDTAVLTTIDR